MRQLVILTLGVMAFSACTSGTTTEKESEASLSVDSAAPIPDQSWVLNGENFSCQKQEREAAYLVCLPYQGPYAKVMNNMKVAAMKIMQSAYNRRWVMNGGIFLAMDELPQGSASFDYRVGVPMKLPKNETLERFQKQVADQGYELMEMPAGTYYHALTQAEPGTAASIWLELVAALQNQGQPTDGDNHRVHAGPYFEYHSDSRNAEMTTVISQSHLVFLSHD